MIKNLVKHLMLIMMVITTIICCSCAKKRNLMKSGDYEVEADGYNGKIKVLVSIDNDAIKDIKVLSHLETAGIGGELKDANGNVLTNGGESPISLIPKRIVEKQTINVDAVSGATVTSYGILHAVSSAIAKAGVPIDAYSSATELANPNYTPNFVDDDKSISDDTKNIIKKFLISDDFETNTEEATYDVVVIGAGGSGLASAVSASENGAKVLVIEKNGEVGGDTLVCGAIYNAPDKELQSKVMIDESALTVVDKALNEKAVSDEHKDLIADVKKEYDEYNRTDTREIFDSENWFALQTWNGGDKVAKLDLVKTLCKNAFDCYTWVKGIGMKFENYISQGAGALWQRTHTSTMNMGTGFITTYLDYIKKHDNVSIRTSTEAISLEKDDSGRVTTVKCKDKYGKEFKVHATKGIVIATGGFSANKDLLKTYNTSGKWPDLSDLPTTNRFACSQGDGIKMAKEIGAGLTDMEQIQLLYLGNLHNGQLTKYPPRDVTATDQLIFINKDGERFVDEGQRRDVICNAVLKQKDKVFYMLESADGANYKDIKDSSWRSADGFTFDYLEKNGYIIWADTLEELCAKLNINIDTLKKTIDTFNKCVDGEKDSFGRTVYTCKLENGPYVATPRQVSVHHTMGGLSIDTEARVLDTNGNVIPGLYACGEVTGGIHGSNRLGGNAVVDTVVFGRIAGKSAAK